MTKDEAVCIWSSVTWAGADAHSVMCELVECVWADVSLSCRFPQDCSLRGDGQCRSDSQSVGVPLRLPQSPPTSTPKAQPCPAPSSLCPPPTLCTSNHSRPRPLSPLLAALSPPLLPYIGPALLRWLLSFCVNYSGCRVRLINVTQSLTHKHTQKKTNKKYPCMVNSTKKI